MIDRERFTQARHSCLEPVRPVGKVPVGELSLVFRTRVPKPTIFYSSRCGKNRKENGPKGLHLYPAPDKEGLLPPHA